MMMSLLKKPKVITVVLTWNSAGFIKECIDSLLSSDYETDLLIVDNNSSDNTREIVKKSYPNIELVNSGDNLGYAGGNNFAIKLIKIKKPKYIFILNPDAQIAPDCIAKLVYRMETEKKTSAVSPMIYFYNSDIVWFAGSEINWKDGTTKHIGAHVKDEGQFDKVRYTQRVNGCAMLLRYESIINVGLMDENYFLYYEETDWSVRFTDAGYKLGIVPAAKVWHDASLSTGGGESPLYQYYMTRNKLYFMRKYKDKAKRHYIGFIFLKSCVDLIFTIKKSGLKTFWRIARSQLHGYRDYHANKFGKQL